MRRLVGSQALSRNHSSGEKDGTPRQEGKGRKGGKTLPLPLPLPAAGLVWAGLVLLLMRRGLWTDLRASSNLKLGIC